MSDEATPRGRTRITSKALSRVASAVAAEALEVEVRAVRVRLDDQRGALALRVSSPIRAASLDRIRADPSVVEREGGPLDERIAHAQASIRDRVGSLTGTVVASVDIRITAVDIQEERRVR